MRLYSTGWSVAEIQDITGCTRRSLGRWCQVYNQEGVAGLADQRNGGNRALLSPEQRGEIQQKLQQYTPADVFGSEHQSAGGGEYWSVADLRRAVRGTVDGGVYQSAQS